MILQSSCTARPPEPLKKDAQLQTGKIYSPPAVSQMPVFPGDLSSYLTSHISYPKGYKGPGGTMYVQFVVNTEGKVEQVKILKRNPFGAAFAQQITNMLENMPQWKPGEKDGKPVKVYYVIPVKLEPR
jgi:protein TonB